MVKKLIPFLYFVIALVAAGIAYSLSQYSRTGLSDHRYGMSVTSGAGVDIAADGGALGFAILSGICFACSAYLMKNEK